MTSIIRVLAPNPGPFTLEGTNTWVLGGGPSLIIDPGPDDHEHLDSVLTEAERIEAIVLTHHHPDHAEGAAYLAKAAAAPVWAVHPHGTERELRFGDTVDVGSLSLRAVHTPGHTPDHVAFFLEEEGALFTGDAVLGRGTSVIDPPEGDMAAYMHSLQVMRDLRARVIYPGHGPVVFDAHGKLNEYLAHRARREAQIRSALAEGLGTPEEIVLLVYEGESLHPSLFPVAARSVLAHLLKLEREGKVARTGRGAKSRFVAVTQKPCERCGRPARPGSRFCGQCAMAVLQEEP
jgi:glyoxylase-like metal-dependent hydrolase (beta-lactamase superfamily II)